MHFKMNLEIYQTSFVMKEVVKKYFDLSQLYLDELAFNQIALFDIIKHQIWNKLKNILHVVKLKNDMSQKIAARWKNS